MPNLREEKKLWKKGYKRVVGLDEAGRGALAGPVVAAAVMIKIPNSKWGPAEGWEGGRRVGVQIPKLRDSKKLSPKQREKIYKMLTTHSAIEWAIGRVSEKMIDKINIKNAAELAMWRAVKKLKHRTDFLIIDGNNLKNLKLKTYNFKLIPKADEKVFSCAAASIIAKVWRDRTMRKYHLKYPQYGFNQHKGYPTKFHQTMLKKYGLCEIHRNSFKPIRQIKRTEFLFIFDYDKI